MSPVRLTTGLPETVLPEEPAAVRSALDAALAQPGERRRHAVSDVVRADPAWPGGVGRARLTGPRRRGGVRLLPGRVPPGPRRPAGCRVEGLGHWSGGSTRPTGGSSVVSTDCVRLPAPSASRPKRSGARSSSVSSTRPGEPIGPVSRPSGSWSSTHGGRAPGPPSPYHRPGGARSVDRRSVVAARRGARIAAFAAGCTLDQSGPPAAPAVRLDDHLGRRRRHRDRWRWTAATSIWPSPATIRPRPSGRCAPCSPPTRRRPSATSPPPTPS